MAEPLIDPAAYRLTYSDWLHMPDDGSSYELLGGDLFQTPPPKPEHQEISVVLLQYLIPHVRSTLRGRVFHAPLGVRLSEEDVPEPDLLVILERNLHRIGEQVIDGAPDLVVEILSPGTAGRDLGPKRDLYERHGVPEYWIVDPKARRIEVLVWTDGAYLSAGLYSIGDELRSALLPGLGIPIAEVFRHTTH